MLIERIKSKVNKINKKNDAVKKDIRYYSIYEKISFKKNNNFFQCTNIYAFKYVEKYMANKVMHIGVGLLQYSITVYKISKKSTVMLLSSDTKMEILNYLKNEALFDLLVQIRTANRYENTNPP